MSTAATSPTLARRLARAAAVAVLPCLVALFVAGSSWDRGLLPWNPQLADLDVYLRAARALVSGQDPYRMGEALPFIYPPFAAILAIPLAWLPWTWTSALWTIGVALALVAIMHRVGLRSWRLSLVASAMLLVVDPVRGNVEFGQVGVFLAALVVLDLLRTPRTDRWPTGIGIGLAAAIKLTPGLFAIHLLLTRRWRSALVAGVTFLVATAIGAVVDPAGSWQFWTGLLGGGTGVGDGVLYLYNQSLLGATARVMGDTTLATVVGLALAAAAAVLGVVAARAWHHVGDEAMAITLCGLATLLASPVSWFHHYVWIAPLAVLLAIRRRWPTWFVVPAWLFVGWAATSPYAFLPSADLVELDYRWWQDAFSVVTPLLGALVLALGWRAARMVDPDRPVVDPDS